jgi:hypothetical protein
MSPTDDPRRAAEEPDVERPDDARGSHNRLGYFNPDESDTSSERGAEEPDVHEDVDRPGDH